MVKPSIEAFGDSRPSEYFMQIFHWIFRFYVIGQKMLLYLAIITLFTIYIPILEFGISMLTHLLLLFYSTTCYKTMIRSKFQCISCHWCKLMHRANLIIVILMHCANLIIVTLITGTCKCSRCTFVKENSRYFCLFVCLFMVFYVDLSIFFVISQQSVHRITNQ